MYVYIFEGGEIQKHPEPPSNSDMILVYGGLLNVIQCESPLLVTGKGGTISLDVCRWDEDADGKFHAPYHPLDEDDEE